MFLSVARVALSYDHHGVVDRLRHGEQLEVALWEIASGVEINQLAILMEKGMHRPVGYGGKADNLARRVHAKRTALSAAECANITHALVRLRK
jgi:hypothetical protein